MDPVLLSILASVPEAAADEDSEVQRRLFPPPMEDADEQALADWREFVRPELRNLFESSMATFLSDLEQVEWREDELADLRVPEPHIERWVHALNQARLALAARHGFAEEELQEDEIDNADPERLWAKGRVHFLGFIQEALLQMLQGGYDFGEEEEDEDES